MQHDQTKPTSRAPWAQLGAWLAALGTFVGAAPGVSAQVPAAPSTGFHRAGPINSSHHFPDWYQDRSGLTLEFGTPLTQPELDGGWLLLLTPDTVAPETYTDPRSIPSTFADEHFYWHCSVVDTAVPVPNTVDPAGTTRILVEMSLEAAFSTGPVETDGSQIVFTRQRIFLTAAPFSGNYILETPFKTFYYNNVVAGERLFSTEDFGVAAAPEGFQNVLAGPVGPFLLPAQSEGGAELPPVDFEGRKYIADPNLTYFITGSPIGRNFVRLTGPEGFVWSTNRFSLTGRIKTGAIPSNVSLSRVSRFDAPGDQRIDAFAKAALTLQPRLPGQPQAPSTQPTLTLYPAPPVVDPTNHTISVPPGVQGLPMVGNGPNSRSLFLEHPIFPIPTAVTAVDDAGFVSSLPVTDTVVITEANYSPSTKLLTVTAATANVNTPAEFYLAGVDGVGPQTTFTSTLQVPGLNAPPSTVTVYSTAGGASTVSVTVGIPVTAGNHPPVAVNDEAGTVGSTPTVVSVLLNDTDPDRDRLSIDSVTQPVGGTVTVTDLNSTLTFTANPGASGPVTFQYTVTDLRGGFSTGTVTVNVDGAPLAASDNTTATAGIEKAIDVLLNDSDPDGDPMTIVSTTTPELGGVALGTVSITGGGKTLAYTPRVGTTGTHTFSYTITDGRGGFSTATVNVVINSPPIAVADAVYDVDKTTIQIQVLANDTDIDGDTLALTAVSTNARATITLANNTVIFAPNADVLPVETFTYDISDGRGGSARGTVTVTQNASPIAVADTVSGLAGSTVVANVLSNDTDPDAGDAGALVISGVTQPLGGTVTVSQDRKTISLSLPVGATTGTSFQYTVSDGRGGSSSATVNVLVNRAPVAVNDTAPLTLAGSPVTISVLANDTDPDGDAIRVISVLAANGATALINADNTITFTASPTVVLATQTFSYTISDTAGGTSTATVTVPVNNPPTAVNDTATTTAGTSVTVSVLANDTDANAGDVLTVSGIVAQTTSGTASVVTTGALANRAIFYTPNPGFTGTDSLRYTVTDGRGGSATATVTITVTAAPNRAPLPVADTATTAANTAIVISVLNNDTDPDNDPLTITAVTQPGSGTAAISNAGKTITYTPVFGASSAPRTFNYTVSDGRGGTATSSVTVTVNDVVTITTADYTVSRNQWNLAGTAGPSATVTLVARDSAGNALATIGSVTADTRGAWKLSITLAVPTTAVNVVATSNQRGTATRAILRR